jgi:hypothetical protein
VMGHKKKETTLKLTFRTLFPGARRLFREALLN